MGFLLLDLEAFMNIVETALLVAVAIFITLGLVHLVVIGLEHSGYGKNKGA